MKRLNRQAILISSVLAFLFGVICGVAMVGIALDLPGTLTEDVAKLRKEVGLFRREWKGIK